MKISKISEEAKEIFKKTAKKLSGTTKREYIATITIELLDGNARKAERVFGWGRATVKKGMRELATGIKCIDDYSARGNKKTEEKYRNLSMIYERSLTRRVRRTPIFRRPLHIQE